MRTAQAAVNARIQENTTNYPAEALARVATRRAVAHSIPVCRFQPDTIVLILNRNLNDARAQVQRGCRRTSHPATKISSSKSAAYSWLRITCSATCPAVDFRAPPDRQRPPHIDCSDVAMPTRDWTCWNASNIRRRYTGCDYLHEIFEYFRGRVVRGREEPLRLLSGCSRICLNLLS